MPNLQTATQPKPESNTDSAPFELTEEEVLMYSQGKDKEFSTCQRIYSAIMKGYIRYLLIISCVLGVSYLSYTFLNFESTSSLLSPDRADAYKVKVMPASLSDEELNALPKETFSYLTMIDAGSSGCRAHVYRFGKLGSITGPLYVLPEHNSLKVKPGLSSFADHPQDAGKSLAGLVDFMKEQVPEADWAVTPIWLKATAGLRMLPPEKSEAVLESVRDFLGNPDNSPFLFRRTFAKIIPGNEEGGFGWIAFNYLKKIIGPKRHPESTESPYAVVEMGGASAQVSQLAPSKAEADAIPPEYRFSFNIEKNKYDLYTYSYLGFGAEQGREQLNRLLQSTAKSTCPTTGRRRLQATNAGAATALTAVAPPAAAAAPVVPSSAGASCAPGTSVVKDPCLYTGYGRAADKAPKEPYEGPKGETVLGTSDPQQCVLDLQKIFTGEAATAAAATTATAAAAVKSASSSATCKKDAPMPQTFNCIYQPDFVTKSENFLVFENFYYVSSALGVKPAIATDFVAEAKSGSAAFPLVTTPKNILDGANALCGSSWQDAQAQYPLDSQPKDVNLKMCFVGSFAYSFLVDGLKVPADKKITIQKDVGDSEIEWALGAAYKEAAELLKRTNLRPV